MFESLDRIVDQLEFLCMETDDDGKYTPHAQELYEIATALRMLADRAHEQWLDSLVPHLKDVDPESVLNIPCASGDPLREN